MTAEDWKAVNELIAERNALAMRVQALEAENAAIREDADKARTVLLRTGAHPDPKLIDVAESVTDRQNRLDSALGEISGLLGCELDETEILCAIRALKARAVPALEYDRMGVARSGCFIGCVGDAGVWSLGMTVNGILIVLDEGKGGKDAMDAAFLRLVGVRA